ncbi:MAG: TerD family protein [Planctomycetaceae bacterium]
MAVELTKGGNVSLTKTIPGLNAITIGLGWDARSSDGAPFDLDAVAFLLTEAAGGTFKVRSDSDFIFYNNLVSSDGAVRHMGDNTTGQGDGDDEQIKLDFTKMAIDLVKVKVCVTINEAESRRQSFGQVSGAFIRVVNDADNKEIARYDLSEDASTETAMVFGEVYRHGGEWKFRAVGQGFAGGLAALAKDNGVDV